MKKLLTYFALSIVAMLATRTLKAEGYNLVAYLPQENKINRTQQEMAGYYLGIPINIVEYSDYSLYQKATQKAKHMAFFKKDVHEAIEKAFGRSVSDSEIVQLILAAPSTLIVGKVNAKGIKIGETSGDLFGTDDAITRDPYPGERKITIVGPFATVEISQCCLNPLSKVSTASNFEKPANTSTTTIQAPAGATINFTVNNYAAGGAGGTATATATNGASTPGGLSTGFTPLGDPRMMTVQTGYIPQGTIMQGGYQQGVAYQQPYPKGLVAAAIIDAILPDQINVNVNKSKINSDNNINSNPINIFTGAATTTTQTPPIIRQNTQVCAVDEYFEPATQRCMKKLGGGVQVGPFTTTIGTGNGGVHSPIIIPTTDPTSGDGGVQNPLKKLGQINLSMQQ